ncbi:MAG TPA: nuclear transport factor 2 family protein [Opitutaceae bacterium]
MGTISSQLVDWTRSFAAAVRARDFATAEEMFLPGVVSFGTVGHALQGREQLRRQQWEIVWNRTAGFAFDESSLVIQEEPNLAVILAEWSSTGYDAAKKSFLRRGRATIVLRRFETRWLASHTHFSFTPVASHDPLLHD